MYSLMGKKIGFGIREPPTHAPELPLNTGFTNVDSLFVAHLRYGLANDKI